MRTDPLLIASRRILEGRSTAAQYPAPGDLARAIDPRTVATPALRLLDKHLLDMADGRTKRLIWSMPPQEGKSQRVSRTFPTWLLNRDPDKRIAIASYELGTARRWGRSIRNDITANTDKLGIRVRQDTSAAHEWQLEGHQGGVYSVGIGGALTGRPVDVLIIDDPIKGRAEAESPVYRERCWDFWTDTARTRLAPDAVVIIVLTRWHEDDIAGRLLAGQSAHEWTYVNVPAQAETDSDPLGRSPGEYLLSARGRTILDWEDTKRDVGSRTWTALYQGRPAPADGGMVRRSWWRHGPTPAERQTDGSMLVPGRDTPVIQSWDMTFKDTKGSDFVVGQVWAKIDGQAVLLDQVRDRMDFPTACRAVQTMSAKWPQATAKLIEDKANGPAVIAQLSSTVPGLIAIEPQGSKMARLAAVSPFIEAGNVLLPESTTAPWIDDYITEHSSFPNGAHDDQVDATSQALARLMVLTGPEFPILDPLPATDTTGAALELLTPTVAYRPDTTQTATDWWDEDDDTPRAGGTVQSPWG